MNKPTDIIARMEAIQQRFGEMPPDERARRNKFASEIAVALHTETKPRLQLCDKEDRAFDGEDADAWAEVSERQGAE